MPPNPNVLDLPNVLAPLMGYGPVGIIAILGWALYWRTEKEIRRKERENRVLTEKFIALAVSNGQMLTQANANLALLQQAKKDAPP